MASLYDLIKEVRMQLRMAVQAFDEGAEDETRKRLDKCIGVTESICAKIVDGEATDEE